ncbi:helix-turn-helix transcriptional regulator [Halodesulfovibrio spirochaetisodalis]|uniref:helix-turn-helix transcriptional regulator n=1 Tax=Halodesulfovibrio spirochaetisodalis TaxID=1560234 RepID=UPI000833891D|nr:LuxR family transcriptional regulator [Halodesulfovibrio spirochaetisodalis]
MDDQLQSILEHIVTSHSSEQLWDIFVEYAHSKGVIQVHTWFGNTNDNLTFISTTPDWWFDYYIEKNFIKHDHLAQHALTGHGPLLFGYDKDKSNPLLCNEAKKIIKLTTLKFNYGSGITMPSFHNNKRIGGFNLCFPETVTELNNIPTTHILELLLVTCTVHERMYSLTVKKTHTNSLTPRQQECLTMLARGLTSHQIAEKLGISHHTVKMHIDSAKERLKANTRIQAVAKALTDGLISIA